MNPSNHMEKPVAVVPAFISAADGARLLGISKSGFYQFVQRGLLPPPMRLGSRALWQPRALVAAVHAQNALAGASEA